MFQAGATEEEEEEEEDSKRFISDFLWRCPYIASNDMMTDELKRICKEARVV
jgi:hypothetical protein